MTHLRCLSLAFCLFAALHGRAQFQTKVLEFPEYGFKIPFFANATRTVYNAGKPDEHIDYAFSYTEKGKLFGLLRIYPKIGCFPADSLYSQSEAYVRNYQDNPTAFRILTSNGNTYPFGWTGYFATAVIDDSKGGHLASRELQAFINGKVLFMVDIVSQQFNFMEVTKPILEDPGYNSILLPHNLTELNLRIFVRGNVDSQYEPSDKKYYIGRCDKLGTLYPYATFARLDADPASSALGALGEARQIPEASNAKVEDFPAEGAFSRLSGSVYKVSYHLKDAQDEGEVISYYFTFNNSHYVAALIVPFIQDDNKVYLYQDNAITRESVPLFDERLQQMLGTIEKIR